MKKTINLLILFICTTTIAQTSSCGATGYVNLPTSYNRPGPQDGEVVLYDSKTPYVFNAFFTLVQNDSGQTIIDYTQELNTSQQIENKFLDCIKILNLNYNQYNIFFKYTGYQIVQDDSFEQFNQSLNTLESLSIYNNPEALNFYFINSSINNSDAIGGAIIGGNTCAFITHMLNSNQAYHDSLIRNIIHQVAHNLALYHTYETGENINPSYINGNVDLMPEHVTRNVNNPLFNANIAGDQIVDTPAQPFLAEINFPLDCGPFIPISTITNVYGETYPNDIVKNYMNMSNSYEHPCPWNFTAGQIARMRNFTKYRTNIIRSGGLNSVRNNVYSLYEPFDRIKVIFPTILSTTDNGDGTAKVCRGFYEQFRFQPGFTYTFPNNQNPDPLTATTNDTPFVSSPPFNCPVTIAQLAPGQTNLTTNTGQAVTIERGQVCVNEPFTSGSDTRMKILGSMNITIEELDTIKIKDPDLYDKLISEYYHIIKKETDSGALIQSVIYKN